MSVRFSFDGLEELRAALRQMPKEFTQNGGAIVVSRATEARDDIVASYPEHTGNLKQHVSLKLETSGFGVVAEVKNTARHGFIYEHGTKARHTDIGANRGAMPPGNIFGPIMSRKRRAMLLDLVDLLERAGLEVAVAL